MPLRGAAVPLRGKPLLPGLLGGLDTLDALAELRRLHQRDCASVRPLQGAHALILFVLWWKATIWHLNPYTTMGFLQTITSSMLSGQNIPLYAVSLLGSGQILSSPRRSSPPADPGHAQSQTGQAACPQNVACPRGTLKHKRGGDASRKASPASHTAQPNNAFAWGACMPG